MPDSRQDSAIAKEFDLSSYDYSLPADLIATHPIKPQESARLLVYHRDKREIIHTTFASLLDFIPPKSTIVLNDTRVLKARLYGRKIRAEIAESGAPTLAPAITTKSAPKSSALNQGADKPAQESALGGKSEILFHAFLDGGEKWREIGKVLESAKILDSGILDSAILDFKILDSGAPKSCALESSALESNILESCALVLAQVRGKAPIGTKIVLDSGYFALVVGQEEQYKKLIFYRHSTSAGGAKTHLLDKKSVLEMLESIGHIPLPPYIKREAHAQDEREYQSVFAKNDGAIAAPTASLHLSESMLEAMRRRFELAYITLHIGAGTFASVQSEDIRAHPIHSEALHISAENASKILQSENVLCVGTSALRSVEFLAKAARAQDFSARDSSNPNFFAQNNTAQDSVTQDFFAQCDEYIHPGSPPAHARYLLTNFHLPKSTLVMLVAAMVGLDEWRRIYDEAIAQGYRFYSYGDGMLIL